MSYVDKLVRHERLMTQMADRNGVDVHLAEQVGLLTPEEVFDATLACTGCQDVAGCQNHLETGQDGMPDACRNIATIQRLAGEMAELGLSDT